MSLYTAFDTAIPPMPKPLQILKSLYTYFSLMVDLYDANEKQHKNYLSSTMTLAKK